MSDVHSVGGYVTAGSLFALGLASWQVLAALLIGITIVYFFCNLVAKPSQVTGVPYPVICRSAFGVLGANIPAIIRGLIAVAWYGIQTFLASAALDVVLVKLFPGLAPYAVTADYQATRDGFEWIKQQLGPNGIQIVGEDFPPLGNRDYSSIVDKIAKSDADGVLLMLTGSDVVTLLKQAGQVNLGKSKVLFGPVASDETMAAAVGQASLGVNTGLRYDHTIDTAANRKFVEAYRKKFGVFPSMTAGEAYDGMAWWLDTVEKTGSWDKEKWVDAFAASVRENSVEGKKTMRACDHQALQPGFWGEVVQGTPPAPTLTMKISKVFAEEKLFEPCKN